MYQETKYIIKYDKYFWEEWSEQTINDSFESIEEAETFFPHYFTQSAIESDSIMNIKIVKVVSNYETVKVIKGRCECDM